MQDMTKGEWYRIAGRWRPVIVPPHRARSELLRAISSHRNHIEMQSSSQLLRFLDCEEGGGASLCLNLFSPLY